MIDAPQKGEKTLYLIDGSSYIHRAYHAVRGLATRDGFPTNAIFGFSNMLLKVLREHEPSYTAMVMDAPGPTFRHEIYPLYKANRPPMPEDLALQIPRIDDLVEAFRLPVLRVAGVEADDIIATLVKLNSGRVDRIVIVSSDKDLMQLVSDDVVMLDTMKNRWIGRKEVQERFGVSPDRVPEMLALIGDSSDNIPGLPGVGPKTAEKLMDRFGSLEGLLEKGQEVGGKLAGTIASEAQNVRLFLSLVKLKDDLEIPVSLEDLRTREPDPEALREIFEELEFVRLIGELTPQKALDREGYRTILTVPGLDQLCRELREAGRFAVDTETDGRNPMTAPLVGISFSWSPGKAAYLPLAHSYLGVPEQISMDNVKERLGPVLSDPDLGKIGQNIKYDMIVLARAGLPLENIVCDTMIASWLGDPSRRSHGLSEISSTVLGHTMIEYKEVTGSGKNQVLFSQVPVKDASTYSCEDADVTFRVSGPLSSELESLDLLDLFMGTEVPLVRVLTGMEMTGVLVDTELLGTLSAELNKGMMELETKVHHEAGKKFNINSPRQLSQVLFTDLGLTPVKKTKTGYSTDDDVLLALASRHHLPAMIREYRSLAKLKSTYADALPNLVHPSTGRVHTSFNQTATATGRLSSSDPNLQNIPIRTDLGKRIREAFAAPAGMVLLSADYSQIELRILAHLSADANLVEAFNNREDIHARTARQVFGAGEKVEPELRRRAKVVNFGIIYGMSAFGLSRELGIDPREASAMIEDYFRVYSGVKDYMDGVLEEARKKGFVTTMHKRRRNLPELTSPNANTRQYGERMAINTPIQGTAADIIKMAMLKVDEKLHRWLPDTRMILTVHDELIFEVPEEKVEQTAQDVKDVMESVADLDIPLVADVGWGKNWAEAH